MTTISSAGWNRERFVTERIGTSGMMLPHLDANGTGCFAIRFIEEDGDVVDEGSVRAESSVDSLLGGSCGTNFWGIIVRCPELILKPSILLDPFGAFWLLGENALPKP